MEYQDTASKIEPIETKYKGYKFRSRLEARWAIFFDALNLKWDYEIEGYNLGIKYGCYLPDFYLSQVDSFCEVKPEGIYKLSQIKDKYYDFTRITKRNIILLMGVPRARFYPIWMYSEDGYIQEDNIFVSNYHNYPENEHRFYGCPGSNSPMNEGIITDEFCAAIAASRSARFEYGEHP